MFCLRKKLDKQKLGGFLNEYTKNDKAISQISKYEAKHIERLFARYFSTEDGQKIIAYLSHITFRRLNGVDATHEQLRHMEGQRALLHTILRLIERGKTN